MSNKTETHALHQQLGQLFSDSLKLSHPVEMLHIIREKIQARGYQPFDKEDIIQQLGQLQHLMGRLHSDLLDIHDILKEN
jgi:hypothetical protein